MSNSYPKTVRVEIEGDIGEAVKDAQNDPWVISYPNGGDRFFGTVGEVKARMRAELVKTQAADAKANHNQGA